MAVPTYDELLAHYDVEKSIMKQTFDDEHLREFSLVLDMLETLAKFLGIPNSDITAIKNQGCAIEQRMKMLECWKQRCGSMATYGAMVKALLKINRTDLAEKVITLRQSSNTIPSLARAKKSSLLSPTLPASSSEIEEESLQAAMSLPPTPNEYPTQDVIPTLKELEEDFYNLVIFIEETLENSEVSLNAITRRFRMLPQSIRRQYETDENYTATRQNILDSRTIKKLFDNLTELKHWSYMIPDTLAHILKDVKIDGVHSKVKEYENKLRAFKANTKLRELIGISFPVPDYCMELTMEVEGWEDKTIQEVEDRAVNIVRRAAYSGSPHVRLGWKGVFPGSINVTFILMEPAKLIPEKIFEDNEVISVHVDGNAFHRKEDLDRQGSRRTSQSHKNHVQPILNTRQPIHTKLRCKKLFSKSFFFILCFLVICILIIGAIVLLTCYLNILPITNGLSLYYIYQTAVIMMAAFVTYKVLIGKKNDSQTEQQTATGHAKL